MDKPYVKLVSDKDVKNVILPQVESLDSDTLVLYFEQEGIELNESFDVIFEDGNKLKFLKVNLKEKKDKYYTFDILRSKDVIKREYERISAHLEVVLNGLEGNTVNISAGGMQVQTLNTFEENKVYDATIKYAPKDVDVKYEILRITKEKNRYLVSGKFLDMDKESKAFVIQQNLIQKIFRTNSDKKVMGGFNG